MRNQRTYPIHFWALFWLMFLLQMAAAFWFCLQKEGFHYDEYYSYYSSNVTYGLGPGDGEWKTGAQIRDEFMVLPGQQFRFADVVRMQSYDVHPPLYYLLLHTICSLTPGVFSKWSGLGLNLALFAVSYLLLAWAAWMMGKRKKETVLAACLLYGCSGAVYSGVVLVRMYLLLGLWILLFTCLHLRALEKRKWGPGFYLSAMAVTYVGFLTHYYFVVYLFFAGAALECYFFFQREASQGGGRWRPKWRECFLYGFSLGMGMLLAVCSYPACLGHIFRGYRGVEAMGAFFDLNNTAGRLSFFLHLLNTYAFGSMLPILILLLFLLGLTGVALNKLNKRRRTDNEHIVAEKDSYFWERHRLRLFPAIAVVGYFAVVARTALLAAESANRYQIPVYGLLFVLTVELTLSLARRLCLFGIEQGKALLFLTRATVLLVAIGQLVGLCRGNVLFLYREDRENIIFAKQNQEEAVMYYYNPDLRWMVWDDSLELMQYDEIYFVDFERGGTVEEERLLQAERIWVYCARGKDTQRLLERVIASCPQLKRYQKYRELLYCDLYLLEGDLPE